MITSSGYRTRDPSLFESFNIKDCLPLTLREYFFDSKMSSFLSLKNVVLISGVFVGYQVGLRGSAFLKKKMTLFKTSVLARQLHPQYADPLTSIFKMLNEEGLLTEDMAKALMDHAPYASFLKTGIEELRRFGILTEKRVGTLIENIPNADAISWGFFCMRDLHLPKEDWEAFIDNADLAHRIIQGFKILSSYRLLTRDTAQALIHNARYALRLARGIEDLHVWTPLQMEDNIQALIQNPEHAQNLTIGFLALERSDLVTENRQTLMDHAAFADSLGLAFEILKKEGLLNAKTRQTLIDHAQNADTFFEAFKILKSIQTLTEPNVDALLEKAEYIKDLIKVFEFLAESNSLTSERMEALLKSAAYVQDLLEAFKTLQEANLENSENIDLILQNPEQAIDYAQKIVQRTLIPDFEYPNRRVLLQIREALHSQKLSPTLRKEILDIIRSSSQTPETDKRLSHLMQKAALELNLSQ